MYGMMRLMPALVLAGILIAGCGSVTPRAVQSNERWDHGREFDHLLIIVLENQNYDKVIASPYMKALAGRGTLFSNFNGLFHPSYSNYLAMIAGDGFDTHLDIQKDLDARTIADLLEPKGLTWKQYAEGYPGNCFTGTSAGRYRRKHVPFLSFTNIQHDPARCANVMSAEKFDTHNLPSYAFYSPDMDDDGHDTGLDSAVTWLQKFLDPILADPVAMKNTLIEITFDESETYSHNHIYTVFLGDMVKKGYVESAPYDHYNVLRTVEDNFGIGTLGKADSTSSPITGIWAR
ncbi:MAG: hypothetical protein JWQ98_162 [Chlorobi bacterium]|nr:hypothetical protein [Chlorobiota bacterium]